MSETNVYFIGISGITEAEQLAGLEQAKKKYAELMGPGSSPAGAPAADKPETGGAAPPRGSTALDDPPFKYVVLHTGCLNRIGVAIVQAGHALEESVREVPVLKTTTYCALEAPSSEALEQFSRELTDLGIDHEINREPDAPWNGHATSVATVSVLRSYAQATIRPITERLRFKRIK